MSEFDELQPLKRIDEEEAIRIFKSRYPQFANDSLRGESENQVYWHISSVADYKKVGWANSNGQAGLT